MYTIYHKICGQPAFKYRHRPVAGERIQVDKARLLSGARCPERETMHCGTCELPLRADHLAPGLRIFDMTSDVDMEELYGPYRSK